MSIKDFYIKIGVDPTAVLHRFGDNEKMLEKFLGKFLNDETFQSLEVAVNEKNWENVFRFAHTLKGVSGNFDFKEIYDLSAEIVAEYRASNYNLIPELFVKLKECYNKTLSILKEVFYLKEVY